MKNKKTEIVKRLFSYRFLVLGILALSAASCRDLVFEDRTDCPSFVFFDVREKQTLPSDEPVCVRIMDGISGLLLNTDTVSVSKMDRRSYYLPVKKTPEAHVYGAAGFGKSRADGTVWTVPLGSDADSLYLFRTVVDASGEEVTAPVVMTKEHSKVSVRYIIEPGREFPYNVVVSGNTSGIDIFTGEPVEGEFRFSPDETEPGLFRFIAPRQADLTLTLEMWAKEGVSAETGHVDDLVLWSMLSEIEGFDWTMENLPDINIELDYVRSFMTITVGDWVVGSVMDFSI